jgi:twitching motility protein PilT
MLRVRLAESLAAVISQRLLPRADESGRVLAAEVMVVTGAIRDCILVPERFAEIRQLMEEGRSQYGMQTFDQHLMDLTKAGEVDYEMAKNAASNPADFELRMKTLGDDQLVSEMI